MRPGRVRPTSPQRRSKDRATTTDRKAPEKTDASTALRRASLLGHRAQDLPALSSQARGPVVQRFTVVEPEDYQKAGAHQETMFPSQQLDTSRTETLPYSHQLIEQNLRWVDRYSANPPLKISQHGRLALESTVGQPKNFYGTAEDVEKNRQKLIDIGSRITLRAHPGTRLQVPQRPALIDGNTRTLVQVTPELSPGINPEEALMNADECDSVSEKIVHGKQMVVGNRLQGTEFLGPVSARGMEIDHVAQAVTRRQNGDSIADFAQDYATVRQNATNFNDPTLPISQEVRDYFANGFWRRAHLVPADQVLRALSVPGVPRDLWKQIYELHVGKTEEQRPFRPTLINHITRVMKVRDGAAYNARRGENNLHARLGLNEHASPEVGESFSTMAQTSPSLADEDGVMTQQLSLTDLGQNSIQDALSGMLELGHRVENLGVLAQQHFQNAQRIVPFAEHHAAVVGKDGDDTVTFENYNRTVEADSLKLDLWNKLFDEFDKFDRNIKQEVRDIRATIANVKADPGKEPQQKYRDILRQKNQHLELLRQNFLVVADYVGLKLDTNLDEDSFNQWHFNMYGPVLSTFVDESGKRKRQSFHETWSPSVPNALTVRTTSLASEEFKAAKIREIKTRIGQVAFHQIKEEGFEHPAEIVDAIYKSIVDPILEARTRVEVADALQKARESLEELEVFPELEGDEARQAEILVNKEQQKVVGEMIKIRQQARLERQKQQQYGNQAQQLSNSHPEVSQKYLLWSQEADELATSLEQKWAFFKSFAEF